MLKEDPVATQPPLVVITHKLTLVVDSSLSFFSNLCTKNDGQLRYNLSIDQPFVACH